MIRHNLPAVLIATGLVLVAFSMFRTYPWQAGVAAGVALLVTGAAIHVDREERRNG